MGLFQYRARTTQGKLLTGTLEASSPEEAAEKLQMQGYVPVSLREQAGAAGKTEGAGLGLLSPRVKPQDLVVMSRQLATLIRAGISFLRSLQTLKEQTRNRRLKRIIEGLMRQMEAGSSFSEALSAYPQVFSPLYVSMIRVGEESGLLDEILERLAGLLEHDAATRARVRAALRYPVIVLLSIGAAFTVLTVFVIPRFASLYARSNAALPLPTRVLIWLNQSISSYWPFILLAVGGLLLLGRLYVRTPGGRWNFDRLKLKAPIVGPIVEKTLLSRFANIFATLYRSGIPLLHSLDIVSQAVGNVILERAVGVIKEDVKEGKTLAEPMAALGVFPPLVVQMVAVGEETGALDEMLLKVSEYYDQEAEYAIKNLTTTMEPVLLVFLAGAILFLALGVFLPIWDMIGAFRR
jgi:type II secretory pathway component PulF